MDNHIELCLLLIKSYLRMEASGGQGVLFPVSQMPITMPGTQ